MRTTIQKSHLLPALVCAGCLGLWSSNTLRAADDAPPPDGKDATAQKSNVDQRLDEERKLTGAKYANFSGTVTLLSDAEIQARGDDAVIAKFATNGEDLFLKPNTDEAKAQIKASDKKAIVVKAKCIQDGKYIFVLKTVEVGSSTGFVAPLGGL